MNKIYKKKYRSDSIRLKFHDYKHGIYFVTICTNQMKNEFGKIIDGKMHLNDFGKIIKTEWEKTSKLRDNLKLDEFVIMPNHFHGIISIFDSSRRGVTDTKILDNNSRGVMRYASTDDLKNRMSKISPKSNSLSSIIRLFKSSCTREIRKTGYKKFKWQSRFYEHIIHSDSEFNKIQNYIIENPQKWQYDKYFN